MGIFKRAKRAEEGIIDADVLLTKLGDDNVTEQIALQIPAIASSVDWIASRIKSLPIKLYEERDGKTEEITDDYRLKLLNDENDYDTMTAAEMKEAMVRDYLLCGRAYAFIDWDLNRVRALHYVRAGDVSYNLPVFQALKLRLSFWDADDEFPASMNLQWDEHILDFMRYETTFYAAGFILNRLREEAENERGVAKAD